MANDRGYAIQSIGSYRTNLSHTRSAVSWFCDGAQRKLQTNISVNFSIMARTERNMLKIDSVDF
jgi:hypothetical protein